MGQKVHPKGFRIGIIRDWDSNWYADRDYTDLLHEDYKLRHYIKEHFYTAGISKVEIQRTGNHSYCQARNSNWPGWHGSGKTKS